MVLYQDNHKRPATSNIIVVLILFNHWGMFPVAHSSWLFFGKLQGLQNTIAPRMCDQMSVPKQKAMCLDDPKVMVSVGEGAFHGIDECQYQFRNEKWNCSIIEKGQSVFGKVINRGSREAAFVHAITTAGVMYSVTRACSRGDINSCSCDRRKNGKGRDRIGDFTWGGCSDDIVNGTYFVREFVDASEVDVHDARAGMNLHNNNAGRRAVKKFVRRQCKCHGSTGSCLFRTCWESLGEFRRTGDYLKSKYDNAVHVSVTHNGPNGDLVADAKGSPPSKNDLVYLEESPDYCVRNNIIGTYGTAGRECNATSSGNDGCDKLCCGRGYTTRRVLRTEDCRCEFHWCCEVRCQKCEQIVDVHTCRGEEESLESSTIETPITITETTRLTTKPRKGKKPRNGKRNRKGRRGRKGGRQRSKGTRTRKGRKRNKRAVKMVPDDRTFNSQFEHYNTDKSKLMRYLRAGTVVR